MKEFSMSEIFGSSMTIFKSRFWFFTWLILFVGLLCIIGTALSLCFLLLAVVVEYCLYSAQDKMLLESCRGKKVKLVECFDGMKDVKTAKRVFCACGWADLWVFIWALIPVVGWIIAIKRSYAYAFVPYLVYEREDLSPTQIKEESAKLTNGYKGRMFWMDFLMYLFIFIGALILSLLCLIPYAKYVFMVLLALYEIAVGLFVPPYHKILRAKTYQTIVDEMQEKPDINPQETKEEEIDIDSILPTA